MTHHCQSWAPSTQPPVPPSSGMSFVQPVPDQPLLISKLEVTLITLHDEVHPDSVCTRDPLRTDCESPYDLKQPFQSDDKVPATLSFSLRLTFCPSSCLSIYLSVHLSVCLSGCPSRCLAHRLAHCLMLTAGCIRILVILVNRAMCSGQGTEQEQQRATRITIQILRHKAASHTLSLALSYSYRCLRPKVVSVYNVPNLAHFESILWPDPNLYLIMLSAYTDPRYEA